MSFYRIACYWSMAGEILIEANSLAEAEKKAIEEEGLPSDGYYIEDSFEINKEMTDYLNS